MIQFLGVMIGAYTFTRLLEICFNPAINWFVKVVAALALLVVAFCAAGIVLTTIPPGIQ